ncbi:hypothetical protein SK803_15205 [Lentzea sp. BCCO 10_0856]|uniref:Uncharacterized protein n=1 Tax=Lentzea miocenica TaxID=3095431 RepID=A0ABU4T0A4_9PSEU|nr:hypothetical protein [Lentzea sp. BCCO 10_0856]MDX8031573.1 hypothetical protein [Lentzea sp. BCCO 10_0856]
MCNEVSGEVRGGTVLQVHQVTGDILLHREPARRDWITPARVLAVRVLLVLLLTCAQQYAVTALGDSTFPDGTAVWPLGVDEDEVAELVAARMRDCASEVVTAPVNCPQRGSAQRVHSVKWALMGNTRDGMWVVWHRDRFYVSGTAVMTLGYVTSGSHGYEVDEVRFTAEVRWRGSQTTTADVTLGQGMFPGLIRKEGFELTREEIGAAIRRRFNACTATTESPMGIGCPLAADAPRVSGVQWKLTNLQLAHARIEPDPEFGVVRVKGSYSVTASSCGPLDSQPQPLYTQSGTYRATLIGVAKGAARLLEIKHVP